MALIGGGDLGLVPTMGAFHEGHLSLMRESIASHPATCVSLFVNPLQFGPTEDLSRYPRDEDKDFGLAAGLGVDFVFAPSPMEMVDAINARVEVPSLSDKWEGRVRPGHFQGVATIVTKLFHLVKPSAAYFGWKDLQQCLVIRRMVEDLNFPVALSFHDTIRGDDGLALSSRNAYLSSDERKQAPELFRTLSRIAERPFARDIQERVGTGIDALSKAGFQVDYLEVVDLREMEPKRSTGPAAAIVAARLGSTRLIDNLRFEIRES